MTPEQFDREKEYQSRRAIAKTLLQQEIITKQEYRQIITEFLEKFNPILGGLYPEKHLK